MYRNIPLILKTSMVILRVKLCRFNFFIYYTTLWHNKAPHKPGAPEGPTSPFAPGSPYLIKSDIFLFRPHCC